MPARWTCLEFPASHGSFPQAALDSLSRIAPDMQAAKPFPRFTCPKCWATGFPGWMRPTEAVPIKEVA